jgi:hypothetical protein
LAWYCLLLPLKFSALTLSFSPKYNAINLGKLTT